MIRKISLICLSALLFLCESAFADTLCVGAGKEFSRITDAVCACEDGDEILIFGGIYDEISEDFPIEIEKRVWIHAANDERVIIKPPITFTAIKLKGAGSCIEDIDIVFNRAAGMHVLADDIVVSNCHFALGDIRCLETSCGMWIGGAKNVTVRDTEFENSSIALAGPPATDESQKLVPSLTRLFEVGEDSAYFTTHTFENVLINGKPVDYIVGLKDQEYTSSGGQLIAADCENVTFKNIHTDHNSIGIQLAYCNDCNIIDSTDIDSGIFGIYLAKCNDCHIENVYTENGGHGIDVRAGNRCIVENCHTKECGQSIFLTWSQDCVIKNCLIENNMAGFFAATGKNNLVDNCIFKENEIGIRLQYEPLTVTNSEILTSSTCGLRSLGSSLEIMGNLFSDNLVGAIILESPGFVFASNTFIGSQLNDLYFKNCTDTEYTDNLFLSELDESILIIPLETWNKEQ